MTGRQTSLGFTNATLPLPSDRFTHSPTHRRDAATAAADAELAAECRKRINEAKEQVS